MAQDFSPQKVLIEGSTGKEEEIRILLQKQVSKASIAKIVGVTRPTIQRFIETRQLRTRP
jgi:predicted XRE-type DNA-binding protein